MLTFNNVDFSYPKQSVLNDLNLSVEKGEFVFMIGKSGSGKSTILQLVYFNLLPLSGEVEFDANHDSTNATFGLASAASWFKNQELNYTDCHNCEAQL